MAVTGRLIGDGGSYSGSYVPDLTLNLGITSATIQGSVRYKVDGNEVFVAGQVAIDPSDVSIELLMSLPIESSFTSSTLANGTSVSRAGDALDIESNPATSQVLFRSFNVSDLTQRNYSFTFSYKIV